jgi:hypothetical protein
MNTQSGSVRYVRVLTHGRPLPDIEGDIIQAIRDGARVLMGTAESLVVIEAGSDSRNAAIAAWADGLSQEHGLEWRRVGRDVLFTTITTMGQGASVPAQQLPGEWLRNGSRLRQGALSRHLPSLADARPRGDQMQRFGPILLQTLRRTVDSDSGTNHGTQVYA